MSSSSPLALPTPTNKPAVKQRSKAMSPTSHTNRKSNSSSRSSSPTNSLPPASKSKAPRDKRNALMFNRSKQSSPEPTIALVRTNPYIGTYNGEFVDGLRHGEGKVTYCNGDSYAGAFKDGVRVGFGICCVKIHSSQSTSSATATGPPTGDNGSSASDLKSKFKIYKGMWANSLRHGTGTETTPGGSSYSGEWNNDLYHGQGELATSYSMSGGGCKYIGQFESGLKHGYGGMLFANGSYYEGEWRDNRLEGYGEYTSSHNSSLYTGEYANGVKHGVGMYSFTDGERYDGNWAKGRRTGDGVYRGENGKSRLGTWKDDQLVKWRSKESFGSSTGGVKYFKGRPERLKGLGGSGGLRELKAEAGLRIAINEGRRVGVGVVVMGGVGSGAVKDVKEAMVKGAARKAKAKAV